MGFCSFEGLTHLGPLEDPVRVASKALQMFQASKDSKTWADLPPSEIIPVTNAKLWFVTQSGSWAVVGMACLFKRYACSATCSTCVDMHHHNVQQVCSGIYQHANIACMVSLHLLHQNVGKAVCSTSVCYHWIVSIWHYNEWQLLKTSIEKWHFGLSTIDHVTALVKPCLLNSTAVGLILQAGSSNASSIQ